VTLPETIDAIEKLRAMGARRVRVGDVEAEWSSAPASEAVRPEQVRESPERAQARRREEDENVLFAASG
jgi:hypothetical protein